MSKTALQELMERNHTLANAAQDAASRQAREARLSKAEIDFTFFCEYYLPDYFFCKPAEYQRILYDVIQTRELTDDQAMRLREIVPHDFRSTFKPTRGIKGIIDVEPRQHGKDRWWMSTFKTIVDSYSSNGSGKGVPLGAETSKDGVNLMFTQLDRHLYYDLKLNVVRYTDDGIIICDDYDAITQALDFIRWYSSDRLHMELHPDKTKIGDARKGIDCFGYIVTAEGLRPRKRNVKHALHRIKKLRKDVDAGLEDEDKIRRSLTSFLGYMKYARWSKWAQQVVDASGLWDAEMLKRKIIMPKAVRDQLAWQHREMKRQKKSDS